MQSQDGTDRIFEVGRYCFLAFIGLTPLVMGILPPRLGSVALYRAMDATVLPKTVLMLALAGVSFAALCVSVLRRKAPLYWHKAMWILVALVAWACVSAAFAPSLGQALLGAYSSNDGLVALLGYALVVFLAMQFVRSVRDLRIVAIVSVASGLLVSAYTILQYYGFEILPYTPDGVTRVFATFGNADMLGTYLVFPFAMALGLALSSRPKMQSFWWWGATGVIAAALVATATRGAWIGAMVVALGVAFLAWPVGSGPSRRRTLLFGALIAVIAIAGAAAIVLIRPKRAGSAATIWQAIERLSNERTYIWLTGLRAWVSRPLVGWGPDGFARAFDRAVGAHWYTVVPGAERAATAHNFLVQILVTLGIPALVLTVWLLTTTAQRSFQLTRSTHGPSRLLFVSVWCGFIGIVVASLFGVSEPPVSVWLWLTVGLLLAPVSTRVDVAPTRVYKAVLTFGSVLGVTLALWSCSWLAADVVAGWTQQQADSMTRIRGYQLAARLNPLSSDYRWLVAESLVDGAVQAEQAGAAPATVDPAMREGIAEYYATAAADPGDAMIRVSLAGALVQYARQYPESDAAQRAVNAALEAVDRAPLNPAALGVLARAYQVAGRQADAERTARLARQIAPAYSSQTLGSLGLETTATP